MSAEISKAFKFVPAAQWRDRMLDAATVAETVLEASNMQDRTTQAIGLLLAARTVSATSEIPWEWLLEQVDAFLAGPPGTSLEDDPT